MTSNDPQAAEAAAAAEELVVLVDEFDNAIGFAPKRTVHQASTPLHRAFSSYVFRASDRRLLMQQRSSKKRTWPLVWSNSCCGHPAPGESNLDAARRRLRLELGLEPSHLEEVAPYRYCFTRDGVMENEICPILVGLVDDEPAPDPDEVEAVRWVDWRELLDEIERPGADYSEWCIEQIRILQNTPRFHAIVGV
jgi:isopentenyl-diphosphate delta-isomerase